MKHRWWLVGAGAVCAGIVYASAGRPQAQPANQGAQPAQADLLAYGIGFYLGDEVRTGLESDGVQVDRETVARAFADGLMNRPPAYDRAQLDAILQLVDREMQKRQAERLMETDPQFKALAEKNAERSSAYVQKMANRDGTRELFDGVYVEAMTVGEGASAADADTVVLTFEAQTMDGKAFLAGANKDVVLSEIRETPRRIVQQMHVGDHWLVTIAPEAAFGLVGRPPEVGPNEAVTIDVQLLEVR